MSFVAAAGFAPACLHSDQPAVRIPRVRMSRTHAARFLHDHSSNDANQFSPASASSDAWSARCRLRLRSRTRETTDPAHN